MNIPGKFSILIGRSGEKSTIEVSDVSSRLIILRLKIDSDQMISALSRLGDCDCEIHTNIDMDERIGKNLEADTIEFEVSSYRNKDEAIRLAKEKAPEGWTPDLYFGSQNSFFERDGKNYARCIIRRWV